jgi:hypothetical protein
MACIYFENELLNKNETPHPLFVRRRIPAWRTLSNRSKLEVVVVTTMSATRRPALEAAEHAAEINFVTKPVTNTTMKKHGAADVNGRRRPSSNVPPQGPLKVDLFDFMRVRKGPSSGTKSAAVKAHRHKTPIPIAGAGPRPKNVAAMTSAPGKQGCWCYTCVTS